MSWFSQPLGSGTVNMRELLLFRLGAMETSRGPDIAPNGIEMTIEVSLQELTGRWLPASVTELPTAVAPNPVPEIVTWVPTGPVVGDKAVITGVEAELIDRLSKIAVARAEVLPLVTATPT